jgi:hypothetical protein
MNIVKQPSADTSLHDVDTMLRKIDGRKKFSGTVGMLTLHIFPESETR